MNESDIEDIILANAPDFVRSIREADEDVAEGRTVNAFELLDKIERGRRGGRHLR